MFDLDTIEQKDKKLVSLLQSPTHQLECLSIVDEIIDSMDDKGILELMSGSDGDLDYVLDCLLKDTFQVMYTGNPHIDFAPRYTDRLSQSVEEILRCKNLTYFITSVMPDFQLSWHHLEWGDLVHRYKKLCIEAARDHGKSYYFSNAYALGSYTSMLNQKELNFQQDLQNQIQTVDICSVSLCNNPLTLWRY